MLLKPWKIDWIPVDWILEWGMNPEAIQLGPFSIMICTRLPVSPLAVLFMKKKPLKRDESVDIIDFILIFQ